MTKRFAVKNMSHRRGFTLLEILIATGIFMTIMVVAVGIFTGTVSGSSSTVQLRNTAQTARYIFESIARDVRAAHGLARVVPNGIGQQQLIVKPFIYDETTKVLTINQVEKMRVNANGKPEYRIIKKVYKPNLTTTPKSLMLEVYQTRLDTLTVDDIFTISQQPEPTIAQQGSYALKNIPAGTSLIPTDYFLENFAVLNSSPYNDQPDLQTVQAFLQLRLTIKGKSGDIDRLGAAQTTLQTTIVPRDFVGPYEVVQEGVQGG